MKILILTSARRPYYEIEIDFRQCLKACAVFIGVVIASYLVISSNIFSGFVDRELSASNRLIEDQLDARYRELQLR